MKWCITGLLFLTSAVLQAVNVSGYVANVETGETIISVNVIVNGTDFGTSTNLNGFFIIQGLPAGQHNIEYSHIAYEEYHQIIDIDVKDIFVGTITLSPTTLQAEAIEVTGSLGNIIQSDMDIASFEIDPIVLNEVPQLNQDVFKLIKYSPSVTISDPYSPLYHVRGSDPGENLVQLDGMTIYNPQHFLSSEAIFNPYAIKNIEMLVGGFDAEYGGRNASILYITSREGDQRKVRGEFQPSIDGISGAIEFPVHASGTAMLSGRIGTNIINRITMGIPNMLADFNGTYQTTIKQTRLRFSAFLAHDYMDYDLKRISIYFSDPAFRTLGQGMITNTNNIAVGIQIHSIVMPNLVFGSQLYYSGSEIDNKNFIKLSIKDTIQNVDVVLNYETRILNQISDFTVRAHLSYFTFFNQTLKIGIEQNCLSLFNDVGLYSSQILSSKINSTLQSFYVQDKIKIGRLLLKVGLRNGRFSPHNKWRREPRTSLALNLDNVRIKAAWGYYHQYIKAMDTQGYEIIQFLDYYYPLRNIEPLTSIHYILGIEGNLSDRIDYSVTGFYKDLIVAYLFDYNNTVRSIYGYRASLEEGKGKAYGAEFLVRGGFGRLSGWISYSLSRSTRSYPSIQNGKIYLYDGDQTHNLKTILLYKLSQDITASTTFRLTSGYPKTWETGYKSHYSYDPLNNSIGIYPTYITPVKNNVRYPTRILCDIGWKKKLRSGFGYLLAEYLGSDESYYTMTIQNLLFLHRNPFMYIYLPDYGYYALDVEFLPSVNVGYNIRF